METAIWQKFKDRGVVVIGASSESVQIIQQFVAEQGVTFPIVRDQGSQLYDAYFLSGSISPFPRDFIIDQSGIIRYTNVEYDINDMTLVIESLLEDPTHVEQETSQPVPGNFLLHQNYPNPFNPVTTIEFQLERAADVSITIFDINGRLVKRLIDSSHAAGFYRTIWDGSDDNRQPVPSGIYVYKMETDGQTESKKMTLVK